ncbi:hypothetical protein [Rhodoferax fermentans]|uniref:Uncharacterized protein n=1 Tax=Rhodoferax fermentans TaxID=28066 RepID=A0A1T1AND7_RHOFE|nr:hypothetical protein [Rhodoferax fermentans]MBK1685534.1 hypothetical protein [Rhodoferax fermentans]OOV05656.1 hypothetical protein RF819_02070 [Rhodoferax fermentans]
MDKFEEEATHLRSNLEEWIGLFELPFKAFSDAGCNGLLQIFIEGIDRSNATFADHIHCLEITVPKDVIKAMCIAAAHLSARQIAIKEGDEFSSRFLIKAAEEIGFCRGAAFGVIHEDGVSRQAQSIRGKTGGNKRAEKTAGLKAWAISESSNMVRGNATERARKLMKKVPIELANSSNDPERIIREAINKKLKKNV